jgi:hypothetical protein
LKTNTSIKAFEGRAKRVGFHDFKVADNGCYADVFLQHFYFGWEAAFDSCSEIPDSCEPMAERARLIARNRELEAQAEALDNLFSELPGKLCFGELTDWLAERADKYRRQAEEDDIEGKMQDLLHQRG